MILSSKPILCLLGVLGICGIGTGMILRASSKDSAAENKEQEKQIVTSSSSTEGK